MKAKKKIIAIAYDFDGTLAPGNMQEHSFIPNLGIDKAAFWGEVKSLAKTHDMNEILIYMQLMLKKAGEKEVRITKKAFKDYGKKISFFEGVTEYFDAINAFAKAEGIILEHYIISSGLREIVQGTSIAKYFKMIYASGYKFDANDVAEWPALAIDYTSKTQYLFRINKGIDNAYDNTLINKFVPHQERPVPFSNMIYVGDGETDVPAMKLVTDQGGTSIAVFDKAKKGKKGVALSGKEICEKLVEDGRVHFMAEANYKTDSPLFNIIQHTIKKVVADIALDQLRPTRTSKEKKQMSFMKTDKVALSKVGQSRETLN